MPTREETKARNERSRSLTAAAKRGDLATMRRLLESDANLVRSDIPLMRACEAGRPEAVALLLEHGASPEASIGKDGDRSRRPLSTALRPDKRGRWAEGQQLCTTLLLEAGATTDFLPSWNSVSALVTAAALNNREAIAFLSQRNPEPLSIFETAALGDLECVEGLLDADPSLAVAVSAGGGTALMNCAHSKLGANDPKVAERLAVIARRLIDAGAPLNASTDPAGYYNAFYMATWSGNDPVALVLVEADFDPNRALRQSLDHQCMAVLDWLAPRWKGLGLDLDQIRDEKRQNPLLGEMMRWGRLKSGGWLLDHGADPSASDAAGWTALHYAARRGVRPELIGMLLDHGADPSQQTDQGMTALDVAKEKKKPKVVAVLEGR